MPDLDWIWLSGDCFKRSERFYPSAGFSPPDTHGLTTNNAKHGNVGMCQSIKPCTPGEPSKSMVNPMVHPNSSIKKWYQDSHSHGENQIRWNPGSLCVTAIQQCFAPSEHHLSDLQHLQQLQHVQHLQLDQKCPKCPKT
jgi:hypothetical protein